MFGQDSKLDLAFLNVKHRVGDIALLEHVLVLVKFENRFPRSDFGDKNLRVKLVISWLSHGSLLWLDERHQFLAGRLSDGGGFSKVIASRACPKRLTPDCPQFYVFERFISRRDGRYLPRFLRSIDRQVIRTEGLAQ